MSKQILWGGAIASPVLGVLEQDTEIRSIIEETQSRLVVEPGDYQKIKSHIQWFYRPRRIKRIERNGQKRKRTFGSKFDLKSFNSKI